MMTGMSIVWNGSYSNMRHILEAMWAKAGAEVWIGQRPASLWQLLSPGPGCGPVAMRRAGREHEAARRRRAA